MRNDIYYIVTGSIKVNILSPLIVTKILLTVYDIYEEVNFWPW
jgi:hypothetical protein